ncbi:WAS/WASL-interacting protein family member 3-like [Cavia porcellus]|uniref:WAS/WASL-interacting protein family member 3-like n=1 Tax=Cavia porcellus TaxID=10141 RepID=UPI002FE0A00F
MGHAASRPLSSTLASERPQPKRRKKSGTQRQSAFQPVQGRHGEIRAFVPRQGPLNLPPPDLPPPDPQPPSNFMFCPDAAQDSAPATPGQSKATSRPLTLLQPPPLLPRCKPPRCNSPSSRPPSCKPTQLQAAQMQVAQLQAASLQLAHMQAAPLQVAQLQVAQLRIAPLQATLLPCWVPQAFLPLPEPRLRPVPQAPCFSQPVQPARAPRPPRMRVLAPPSSSQARGSSSPPPP